MTATPDFPPDDIQLTYAEIVDLCMPEDMKRLGGLAIAANEPVPAIGWGRGAASGQDLIIPKGDRSQLVLHANHAGSLRQLRRDMTQVASYIALHEELRSRDHVVGLTYGQLANIAVRGAGFRRIEPVMPDIGYVDRVNDAYDELRISRRKPFELAMIQMPVDELVDRFAIKRLGRDPQLLLSMVAWKAVTSVEGDTIGGQDPIMPILRRIIDSLRDEPDA